MGKANGFEVYKTNWNSLQDRADKEYQRQLRKVNTHSQRRMEDMHLKKEQKIQQLAIQLKKDRHDKEMRDCTFSPRVQVTPLNRKYRQKVGSRHGPAFHRA